jgi:hypothetical protein
MASAPDQDPDSIPDGPDEDIERPGQSTPARGPGVEDTPGTDGGTAGTGDGSGQSLVQDEEFER